MIHFKHFFLCFTLLVLFNKVSFARPHSIVYFFPDELFYCTRTRGVDVVFSRARLRSSNSVRMNKPSLLQ